MSTFCTDTSGIWSEKLVEVGSDEMTGGELTRLADSAASGDRQGIALR